VPAQLTIGALARAAGVPVSTVRFYEREGLLRPRARTGAGYRLYGEEELARLRFIRAAQATGFGLAEVAVLLRPAPCARVQGLIEARLAAVEARLSDLAHVRRVLRAAQRTCRRHEASGRCRVVDALSTGRAPGPGRHRPAP
jgi:MerR family mercuric resistance operon transcriptional regulator